MLSCFQIHTEMDSLLSPLLLISGAYKTTIGILTELLRSSPALRYASVPFSWLTVNLEHWIMCSAFTLQESLFSYRHKERSQMLHLSNEELLLWILRKL